MKRTGLNLDTGLRKGMGVYDLFFFLALVFMIGYFATTPFRSTSLRHVFVLGGAAVMYGASLYNAIKARYSASEIIRHAALLILMAVGLVATQHGIWEAGYAYLNFLAIHLILTTKIQHEFKCDVTRMVDIFGILAAFFLAVAYFSPAAYVFEDGRRSRSLALGMTNPNLTGMMITAVIEILMIGYKRWKHKWLLLLIVAGLFYLAWLTRARSALLACALVLIYTFFFSKRKIPNFIVYAAVALPLLFVPVYLGLYSAGLNNVKIFGKDLFSGRELTYLSYLEHINTFPKWLLGDLGGTLFTNAHNAPLMVLCSVGLVGLIATYHGFIRNLIHLNNNAEDPASRAAIACILSICIQSCFEAVMFSGVFPSVGFMFIFMILAARGERKEVGKRGTT